VSARAPGLRFTETRPGAIVMPNLARIAGTYTFLLFRWEGAAAS
jgi:hypothetical protein